jgi:eukaryotic-like serine/threonine-protein kinase
MVKAVDRQGRVLGEEHPDRLAGISRLAALYSDEGKYAEAEKLFTQALMVQCRVLGEAHPDALDSRNGLGRLRLREHKYGEAESTLRDALGGYEKLMPESWERYNCQSMLGVSLEGQRKYSEAEPLLISGYEGVKHREASIPLQDRHVLTEVAERVIRLYENWKKPEKVKEWHQK